MKQKLDPDKPAAAKKRRAALREKEPSADPDLQKLLHELEVHQIELETQNAELELARKDADEARERYADLYDFAPVGYFALDPDGKVLMVNLTGATQAGTERSRLVGQSIQGLIPPPLRHAFNGFLGEVFVGHDKHTIETEFAPNGELPRFVHIEAQSGPEPQQCRAVVVDISKRKRAEETLRRNEELVSTLIEQAPVGVFTVDSALRLRQANQIAESLLGANCADQARSLQEVIGALWSQRVAAQIVARFRHTLVTGEPYQDNDFHERRRDTGTTEDYEWQIQRLALHDGEIGVVAFFTNVTARKKAESVQKRLEVITATNKTLKTEIARRKAVEATLRTAKRQQVLLLQQSAKQQALLRELSHSLLHAQEQERQRISHELHDVVVQSLVGISFQLANMDQDPSQNDHALKQKVKRAQELVSGTTEIVHSFARDLRPTLLDDLGLVPALKTFLQGFMKDTGIRTSLNLRKDANLIEGEQSTTIYRVVQAALANIASHAHASQVEITISVESSDGSIHMEISDNGQGFDMNAEETAKKRGRLGLLGMRERVEMIGGAFDIQSQPGAGTTVSVTLPASK